MADEPIIPGSVDEPPPRVSPPSSRNPTCEFCGCRLTPAGEIIRMGDDAKRFRALSESLEQAEAVSETLRADLANVRAKLEAAEHALTAHTKKSSSFWS